MKLLDNIQLIAYIALLFLWMLSYWASYIDPSVFSFPALLSLNFLPLTIVSLLFSVYWAFRVKWYPILFIIVLFIVRTGVGQSIAFQAALDDNFTGKRLKIMTQNVEVFNIYAWQEIKNARDKILKVVMEEEPDILLFQEFYSRDKAYNDNNNIEQFRNLTSLKNYSFKVRIKAGDAKDKHYGMVIYSKYPIVNKGEITLENTRNQIMYCDVKLPDSKIVRVFNVHLQSIYLNHDEFDFSYELDSEAPPSMFKKPLSIMRKLRQAYTKRGTQVNQLTAAIEQSPYPVILCGDFNDTPVSYTYNSVKKHLNDAFLKDGLGIGSTYAGNIPALRIDYIFTDPVFNVLYFKKLNNKNADHYGLITEISYDGI